ncbi:hypothetical protein HPULCUR_003969 [Helicostylum pulchrum]|uniref:Uncharacterized protein n=1 Tax=Helicostylum pulchrum TaxID=562976 RepID=A0ABP9XUW7_9FUNG
MPEKIQRVPADARWCLENSSDLTPQNFFEQFHYDNRLKGNRRYRSIIRKWINADERNALMKRLQTWEKSEQAVLFWNGRSMSNATTVVENNTFTVTDIVFLSTAKIIYDVRMGALELERGKIKLLELALTKDLSIHEKNLLKGLESMLNFLPQTKVEVSTLGESELWSTYFNPLFTSIFSKTREDILLRWTNKAAANYSSKRPDAIITTVLKMNMYTTINDLLQITRYFWEVCHTDLDMSQYSWKKEIRYDEYVASVPALLG